jgi:hypothetical protein
MIRFLTILFLLVAAKPAKSQDSLCYKEIDRIVNSISTEKCSRLDTGFISVNPRERYFECYVTDSTGKELRAILTKVMDSLFYSRYIHFYFYQDELIKVEAADWNSRKSNMEIFYYYKEIVNRSAMVYTGILSGPSTNVCP